MRVKQVKQKVDGYEVGGVMADQESCIFTEFKIIKCIITYIINSVHQKLEHDLLFLANSTIKFF